MIKIILKTIMWLVNIGIILFLIFYPLVLYSQNPFIFYLDKTNLFINNLNGFFTIENLKTLF